MSHKAIVHVDGDAFFASCEVATDESLRGLPVVTGQEKGMVIAVTYEGKALGISRGMLMSEARKLVPGVRIFPGNYELYKIMCRRMYTIVRRYSSRVEEYSIDECFADISDESSSWEELVEIARNIKRDLEKDLGMTFSVGLAPTKSLAKVASKWKKPSGFTAMQEKDIADFLHDVPIGAVWGIGRSLSAAMQKFGIKTALEFTGKSETWVLETFAKPTLGLWYELRGIPIHRVHRGTQEKHKSIRSTRTFRPPNHNKHFLLSQLSKNAENATRRLRRFKLQCRNVYFYLKTQTFQYKGTEIRFDMPITNASDVMNQIKLHINRVFEPGRDYRATGVVLNTTSSDTVIQNDLFGHRETIQERGDLFKEVDRIYRKYPGSLFLASSMKARRKVVNFTAKEHTDWGELCLKLGIPLWGKTH